MNAIRMTLALLFTLAVAACTEANGDAAPPGCTQVYSNGTLSCAAPDPSSHQCCDAKDGDGYVCWPAGAAAPLSLCDGSPFDPAGGSGSSGATGTTTSTTGGGGCTVDCPEPVGGVCGGHAEWTSGIIVWPIHRPNDENGNPDMSSPASITHQDPVCTNIVDVCLPYMDPFDGGDEANADALQLQACENLSPATLAALGLDDTTIGQNGWSLVGHVCTQTASVNTTFQGQAFGANATTAQSACLGAWSYEQFCSAADCPDPMVEGSTGAVDSSGDSGGVELEFDCSALEGSDVVIDLRSDPRKITVRGDASDLMWDGPYTAMYYCGGALINSAGKIHELRRGALLSDWGLVEDDIISTVDDSGSDLTELAMDAANQGRTFDVEIKRDGKIVDYVIEVL